MEDSLNEGLKRREGIQAVHDYLYGFLKGLSAAACLGIGAKIAWIVYFQQYIAFEAICYFDAFSLVIAGCLHFYELFRGDKNK